MEVSNDYFELNSHEKFFSERYTYIYDLCTSLCDITNDSRYEVLQDCLFLTILGICENKSISKTAVWLSDIKQEVEKIIPPYITLTSTIEDLTLDPNILGKIINELTMCITSMGLHLPEPLEHISLGDDIGLHGNKKQLDAINSFLSDANS